MPHLLQSACLAGIVISAVPVASISAPDGFARPGKYQYGSCANTVVPDYLRANYNTSSAGDLPLNIKLWIHVVADNKYNAPSQQALDDQASQSPNNAAPLVTDPSILQVTVLNSAFNSHGINFTFSGKSETFNSTVLSLRYQDFVTTFVPQHRYGDYVDLNLFIHSSLWYNGIQDTNGTRHPALLGVSTWPVPTDEDLDPYGDSCVIDADTLPDKNSFESHASGMTAVHQVGHWLGLLHPFQGDDLELDAHEEKDGCAEPNDSVPDTVPQKDQTSGCPAWKSTCGNGTVLDNIHNYMDLSDDEWYVLSPACIKARH